jgi:hypothetical protein
LVRKENPENSVQFLRESVVDYRSVATVRSDETRIAENFSHILYPPTMADQGVPPSWAVPPRQQQQQYQQAPPQQEQHGHVPPQQQPQQQRPPVTNTAAPPARPLPQQQQPQAALVSPPTSGGPPKINKFNRIAQMEDKVLVTQARDEETEDGRLCNKDAMKKIRDAWVYKQVRSRVKEFTEYKQVSYVFSSYYTRIK